MNKVMNKEITLSKEEYIKLKRDSALLHWFNLRGLNVMYDPNNTDHPDEERAAFRGETIRFI